jgi:hypothetical protein
VLGVLSFPPVEGLAVVISPGRATLGDWFRGGVNFAALVFLTLVMLLSLVAMIAGLVLLHVG